MNADLPPSMPTAVIPANLLERRSPLGTPRGTTPRTLLDGPRLRVREESFLHLSSLRLSRQADPETFASTFPLALPLRPNTFKGSAEQGVARYEPRAWLVIGTEASALPARAECCVTDLSARLAGFRIEGAASERLLRSSTAVIPPAGGFVRTFFAEHYAVLLQRLGDDDWRLLVDVSLAQAMADWLVDAGTLVTV